MKTNLKNSRSGSPICHAKYVLEFLDGVTWILLLSIILTKCPQFLFMAGQSRLQEDDCEASSSRATKFNQPLKEFGLDRGCKNFEKALHCDGVSIKYRHPIQFYDTCSSDGGTSCDDPLYRVIQN